MRTVSLLSAVLWGCVAFGQQPINGGSFEYHYTQGNYTFSVTPNVSCFGARGAGRVGGVSVEFCDAARRAALLLFGGRDGRSDSRGLPRVVVVVVIGYPTPSPGGPPDAPGAPNPGPVRGGTLVRGG